MDTRLNAVTDWVRRQPGFARATLTPVAGDASFRRYFRAHSEQGEPCLLYTSDAADE